MEAEKKKVVIVGGGIAGGLLAKSIQFNCDVTLIDPKEYFEIPWAELRNKVEPSFAERAIVYHKDYLTNGTIITSRAIDVTETTVLTADGRQISYDYLVIATGHNEAVPFMREERLAQYKADYEKIKSAKSILIVGGGGVGVELAGEIATDFPEKKVTLVHRGTRLLEFIGAKASKKAHDWLKSKKVEVLLEQSVSLDAASEAEKVYETSTGEKISADCHFLCVGKPFGSSWLQETILKESLDNRGRLAVDEYMRVKGWKNIFAIGDITDVKEVKQGFYAQKHAQVVAKSLKWLVKGGNETKMSTYKAGSPIAIVSLGRKEGVAQFPMLTFSGWLPGKIKSKDLFVGSTRKQMGLPS
ncbi:hypothetical protein QJS10_CPB13g01482 [Acorus calamus]|uniref:FAD/NAD(P)-binding domain-containing protein n=1 Tax=Acorus calamus TaxID=4465 RepID=A0AAV9DFK2_ACOCL|nr:hypothetical protein QJS10_CPB13g01482 [Acorus calamus]